MRINHKWQFRRSNMPPLPEYVDKRKISRPNLTAKNKTWKLENGKRIWTDK